MEFLSEKIKFRDRHGNFENSSVIKEQVKKILNEIKDNPRLGLEYFVFNLKDIIGDYLNMDDITALRMDLNQMLAAKGAELVEHDNIVIEAYIANGVLSKTPTSRRELRALLKANSRKKRK